MGLCGFTQPSVLYMLGHRSGPAHRFRKNQFGGCGTDTYYTLDVWCFPGSLPVGGSVGGKGGVAHIVAHSSPTRLREAGLPEKVL